MKYFLKTLFTGAGVIATLLGVIFLLMFALSSPFLLQYCGVDCPTNTKIVGWVGVALLTFMAGICFQIPQD